MPGEALDETATLALIDRVVAGDARAWQELTGVLFPVIEKIARRSNSMGPLRSSADHCRNVATETIGKLARNGYNALALLAAWRAKNPAKTLMDWLRIVTTNVARDYIEKQLGARRPGELPDDGAKKRALHTLATALPPDDQSIGLRPRVTDQQTSRAILEYAESHLPANQIAALRAWLDQADYAEIATAAGSTESDPKERARYGEKLVRAAVARLRRQFAVDTGVA